MTARRKVSARAVARWDASYVRVSTNMRGERNALQNHGLDLRVYPDSGVLAKDSDLPRLQKLRANVPASHGRAVIVTRLDRIGRSAANLLELMRVFEAHGVKLVSLRDNIDTSGPVCRFMLHILGAIAELERGIIAERVAEDMKLRARRGKWNGGLAPYGLDTVDGWLRVVAAVAVALRRMLEILRDRRRWRGVAAALNREGRHNRGWEAVERDGRVVRESKPPAEWPTQSVRRVLLHPINAGTLA